MDEHNSTTITKDIPVVRICGQRDAALAKMEQAIALIKRGEELAEEAREIARNAASGATFGLVDRSQDSAYAALFRSIDPEKSSTVWRHHTDACIWMHLIRVTGIEHLMDATAREEFLKQLSTNVPEVTEDNVYSVFEGLRADANLIFQRGLARAFSDLDRRFKSHDAFKLGARVILTRVFDEHGYWNYYSSTRDTFKDIERVLAVLDGQKPDPGALEAAVNASRDGWGRRQGVCETRYLKIRTFKNGNAHLWFTRDDLVTKANLVLAAYYGEVLPDAVPREDGEEEDIRTKSGLPAKNLSFYPTPSPVVRELVRELYLQKGARVLEPSAGTGNIATALMEKGYTVDAIEIDADRVAQLSHIPGLNVMPGNFLCEWLVTQRRPCGLLRPALT
jgi:hypothetical protein